MYDVVIRGGEIVDGTGKGRVRADLAIKDSRIARIGHIDDSAETALTIDATGKCVCPGFVDVHTHYDAQVFWDPALTPSCLHGVTTVFSGNCGFTIAPLSNDDADNEFILRMLSRVEGIPVESLRAGVPWNWRTSAEYFEHIEGQLGINAGFSVGHSTLRRVVMGRDASERTATPDEVVAMSRLLGNALEIGAIGFSTSWARTHVDGDGRMVPSRWAPREEVVSLAAVLREYEGTSLEITPQIAPAFDDYAIDIMVAMSVVAERAVNWNVLSVSASAPNAWTQKLAASDFAHQAGGRVVALTAPLNFGVRLCFATATLLDMIPGWEQIMRCSMTERARMLASADGRELLDRSAQDDANFLKPLADWGRNVIFDVVAPENEPFRGRAVGEIAVELGCSPWEALCQIVLRDELWTSFGIPAQEETAEDWKARVSVWRDHRAVIGASDAGAHLDLFATFNYTTGILANAVRDARALTFEEAIHLLTQVPAELYGLIDRGTLTEGAYADVVVVDPDTVASAQLRMVRDLPGGAARLFAGAEGIDHVLVNGRQVVTGGRLTGARPGTLLRAGRDTRTPQLR